MKRSPIINILSNPFFLAFVFILPAIIYSEFSMPVYESMYFTEKCFLKVPLAGMII
ncbi:MAG TPA: hypothetical protein PLI65_10105 [Bacteroidales bacterium]|nr:hypothetical protein [Bacteroidales bacterium]